MKNATGPLDCFGELKVSLCFHSVELRPTCGHRARPGLLPTNNELAAERVWSFTCTSPGCDTRAAVIVGHSHFGCRVAFRLFPAGWTAQKGKRGEFGPDSRAVVF